MSVTPWRAALARLPATAVALALGLLVSGAILGLRAAGLLEPLELGAQDALLRPARGAGEADPRVVLIRIHESDIQTHGHPLPDGVLARALAVLSNAGARAIGVDLYRDRPVPPGEADLERAVLSDGRIVMTEKIGEGPRDAVPAPRYVAGGGQVGFSDVLLDADGRLRRGLLMMSASGSSLATRLALLYLAHEGVVAGWRSAGTAPDTLSLHLGDVPLRRFRTGDGAHVGADDGGYQILLGYPRGRPQFASYSLGDLLSGRVETASLRDRVVLVGTTAASVQDRYTTPFGETFGVEHHASVVSELLDRALGAGSGPRFLAGWQESGLVLLLGAAAALLAAHVHSASVLGAICGLLALGAAGILGLRADWWLPVLPASLAWAGAGAVGVAYVAFRERADRKRVMEVFGRFLDRDVADEIWRQRDAFFEGGRPRPGLATITVMMTDLEGYTTVAEQMGPARLLEWIDGYLEAMARLVGSHRGIVDDYAGDGIKADFGVPIPRTTEAEIDADARAAVDCALAMQTEVARLNERWEAQGLPRARVRIGIHTGPAVVGPLGGVERLKYTSVGDTVNTAARLESYRSETFRGEEGGVRILVSEETFRRLGGRYRAEEVGKATLKGKSEPVVVYRIHGALAEAGMKASKRAAIAGGLALAMLWAVHPPARAQQQGGDMGAEGTAETTPVYRPPAAESAEARTTALPLYVPPSLGMPGGRVGAGTRSAGRQYSIQVLAPDHVGLTTATQPTLYWYLAAPTTARIDLTIRNGDAVKPTIDKPMAGPFTAGIHAVRLADHDVRLEPGKSYQWFVAVVPDPDKRSSDFVSGAWIRPDAAPQGLEQRLQTTPRDRAVFVYAQSSIWYDALASVSEQIEASPHDARLRAQRAALLEQVGLSEVADYDRSQAGGM